MASAIQGLALSRARASPASRNSSEVRPVMPAVVENILAGQPALAGERDRGDAEAGQIGDGIAEIAELRHDHRQMPAADRAVGDARQHKRQRGGDAGAARNPPASAAPKASGAAARASRLRPRPKPKGTRMRARTRRDTGAAPAAGRVAAPSVTGSARRLRPSIAPAHRTSCPRGSRARARAKFRSCRVEY